MKISLVSIVKGLTNREVKANAVTPNKVISYSGQYYNGSDIVYVSGNQSSELVQKALVGLNEKYRDVQPTFPSAKDGEWYPTDEVPAGASCKWVMPD